MYITDDRVFVAVDVAVVNGELRAGAPRTLFESPSPGRTFAFDPVGRRFLIPVAPEGEASAPITVVLNWAAGLKKK